jgi:hypothetical protein
MNREDIYVLSTREAQAVAADVARAAETGREVAVTVDGGVKIKIGGGMWSPPLGTRLYPDPEVTQ